MGKFLSVVATAATVLLALACGGGSSTGTTVSGVTYKGAINSNDLPSTANVVVAAYDANGHLKATASEGESTLVAGSNGNDHIYSFKGLADGTYSVKIFTVGSALTGLGGANSIESKSDKYLNLETQAVVDSPNTSKVPLLSKGRQKTLSYNRQANALTTLVMRKVSEGSSSSIQSALGEILDITDPLSLQSLESYVSSPDGYYDGSAVQSTNVIYQSAIDILASSSLLAYNAAQSGKTSSEFASLATSLSTKISSVTSKSLSQLQSSSDNTLSVISGEILLEAKAQLSGSFVTAFESALAAAAPILSAVIGTSGLSGLVDLGSVVSSVETTTASLADAIVVTSFDLAHATYGSRTTSGDFVLSSLAPVFEIKFNTAPPATLRDDLVLTVTNSSTGASVTQSNISSFVDYVIDGSRILLYIKKSASQTLASGELKPGSTYQLKISTGTKNSVKFGNALTYAASVTTQQATVTYPYVTGNTSIVKVGESKMGGLPASSSSVTYYLHSSSAIAVDSTKSSSDYGFFGSNSYLNALITGTAAAATASQLSVSGISAGASSTTSAVVTVSSLVSGTTYTVALRDDQGLKTSTGSSVTDYPKTFEMHVQ
jgi:hypothetical protein